MSCCCAGGSVGGREVVLGRPMRSIMAAGLAIVSN